MSEWGWDRDWDWGSAGGGKGREGGVHTREQGAAFCGELCAVLQSMCMLASDKSLCPGFNCGWRGH